MKIKNLFITLGLALAAVGVAAGVGSVNSNMKEAKAYSATNVDIFVETFSGYDSNGMYMSYKDSSGNNQILMSKTESLGNHIYRFSVPSDIGSLQVFRGKDSTSDGYDPENDGANWSNGWNYTGYFDYDSAKNYVKITGYDNGQYEYSYKAHYVSGDEFFFTPLDESAFYNWHDGNAVTKITFWDSIGIVGVKVSGSSTVSFTVPNDTHVFTTGFNIYRLSPAQDESWNQTDDYGLNASNHNINAFVASVVDGSWAHYYGDGCLEFGEEYLTIAYAAHFLNETRSICSTTSTSADHSEALADIWDDLEAVYGALLDDSSKKSAFAASEDAKVVDAKNRYAHITYRYTGLEQFISGVTPSQQLVYPVAETTTNNTTLIIVLASVITLAAVGGYFLLRKRED